MKKLLYLLTALCGISSFAQDYPFLTPSSRQAMKGEYVDYLNSLSPDKRDSTYKAIIRYKEDGAVYTQAYSDSLFKAKGSEYYTTLTYRDTISNAFCYVLHKRSEEEVKENKEYWKNYYNTDKKKRKKLKGSTIDDLALTDIKGNSYTPENLKGKIIVINFWYVNCAYCLQEMPDLNQMVQNYGSAEVVYFGITFDKKEKVEKLLSKIQFDYTIIPDAKHLTDDRFSVKFYPMNMILDSNHKVVYVDESLSLKPQNRIVEMRKVLDKLTKSRKTTIATGPAEKID